MGTDPNASASITLDQIEIWLRGIAAGVLDLTRDNEGMAAATLGYLGAAEPAGPQPPPLPAGHLTPHFTLAEFIASDTAAMKGIDNTPDADEVDELGATAELMELVRSACGGKPVLISSGYRCPELNNAVGGTSNSAHLYGCAADFTIPAFGSPLEICRAIEPHLNEWGIDQLIYEGGWVHLGRAIPPTTPRAQCLTINSGGTYNGLVA
jgi:zinc D-Ala-D-Ala carboxypeptidase